MLIIWGQDGDVVDLGKADHAECPTCRTTRPFRLVLAYRYSHVYYIFGYVMTKEYFLLCAACKQGVRIDSKEVERTVTEVPIPFMRRYGCLVLLGLVAVLILMGALFGSGTSSSPRRRRSAVPLTAPRLMSASAPPQTWSF